MDGEDFDCLNGVILFFRGVWWTTGVAAAEMQGDVMCLYVLKECRRKKKERRRKRKIVNKKKHEGGGIW